MMDKEESFPEIVEPTLINARVTFLRIQKKIRPKDEPRDSKRTALTICDNGEEEARTPKKQVPFQKRC